MLRVVTDPRCLRHSVPPGFPERPARLEGILGALHAAGREVGEPGAHPDARPAVEAAHDPLYLERFRRAAARGDALLDSADNPLSEETWEAAWGAVDASLHAADWVLEAPDRRAFAAVRPPGHHAERALAMGFCFLNTVAVVAQHLRRRGVERVAILDFDVHHGNGTQHLFERRRDVFYASTHQYPFYPGTGAADETGIGEGQGATLNVPLQAGTGDAGYAEAITGRILPALRDFRPGVVLLSAGFDAWQDDPLGGMAVTEEGFRNWGAWCRELAEECAAGRGLALLEGGYDLAALPRLVGAFLTGWEGETG